MNTATVTLMQIVMKSQTDAMLDLELMLTNQSSGVSQAFTLLELTPLHSLACVTFIQVVFNALGVN